MISDTKTTKPKQASGYRTQRESILPPESLPGASHLIAKPVDRIQMPRPRQYPWRRSAR
jgi:hypothetical protein